jgi:hypothetical protein
MGDVTDLNAYAARKDRQEREQRELDGQLKLEAWILKTIDLGPEWQRKQLEGAMVLIAFTSGLEK